MRTKGRKFLPLLLLSFIMTAACMPTVALAKSKQDFSRSHRAFAEHRE